MGDLKYKSIRVVQIGVNGLTNVCKGCGARLSLQRKRVWIVEELGGVNMLKTYCIKFSKNEYKMKKIHTAFHLFSGLFVPLC